MSKQRPRRPIYFVVVRGIDKATGEECGMLKPLNMVDRRAMKDRRYSVGTEVRAELKKPRNVKFHRLAHALGALIAEQLDAFHGLGAHDALKKLQAISGAACSPVEYNLEGIGKIVRTEPRSIAFDELDEGEFQEAMRTMYAKLQSEYWPSLTPEAIEQMVEMYDQQH